MAGKNIKQLTNVTTPVLTDFMYEVQGTTDHNITLQQIKDLFNIGDVEQWQTVTIEDGDTEFINIEDGTIYAGIEIKYAIKRGSRGYRTGTITILVDASHANGVQVTDNYLSRFDGDDLGLNLDDGFLSSGTMQLKAVADSSDASDTILNYKIVSKRPITV